jgi:hypothetical protein
MCTKPRLAAPGRFEGHCDQTEPKRFVIRRFLTELNFKPKVPFAVLKLPFTTATSGMLPLEMPLKSSGSFLMSKGGILGCSAEVLVVQNLASGRFLKVRAPSRVQQQPSVPPLTRNY